MNSIASKINLPRKKQTRLQPPQAKSTKQTHSEANFTKLSKFQIRTSNSTSKTNGITKINLPNPYSTATPNCARRINSLKNSPRIISNQIWKIKNKFKFSSLISTGYIQNKLQSVLIIVFSKWCLPKSFMGFNTIALLVSYAILVSNQEMSWIHQDIIYFQKLHKFFETYGNEIIYFQKLYKFLL